MNRAVLAQPYRAYLFDLDGTLVDSAPDICTALNTALDAGGLPPVSEALTRHWVGHGSRVLLEQALTHHGESRRIADEAEMARLLRIFVDYYTAHIADRSRPYPGVVEALAALQRRGVGLAVVTNKLAGLSQLLLEALDLRRYFGVVVGGDSPIPRPLCTRYACSTRAPTSRCSSGILRPTSRPRAMPAAASSACGTATTTACLQTGSAPTP
jgi:phosphoglycolate phosphatase